MAEQDLSMVPSGGSPSLLEKPERTLDAIAAEIRVFTAGMLNNVIEIGRRMVEAKAMVPYGQFGAWIRENTGYSLSTANNFMTLFTEYGSMQGSLFGTEAESQTFGKLSYSKALALLAVPAEEREAFAEKVDAEHTSVRELKRLIAEREQERDAALQELDAVKADADAVREELSETKKNAAAMITVVQPDDLVIAEATAGARAEAAAEMQEQVDAAKEEARKRGEEADKLRARLEELERRTPDNSAIEKAKTDAVAEIQAKLDKANAAKKKADEKRKEAEARAKDAAERMAAAEAEAKRAAVGNNKDLAAFSAYYEQAKDIANRMRGVLLKVREADPETAGKLCRALDALGDAVKEAAK